MRTRKHLSSRSYWAKPYKEFLKLLVGARLEAGLTQRAVADALGRSQSFIAKSETGERRVDIVELAMFAAVYGKPITHFIPRL